MKIMFIERNSKKCFVILGKSWTQNFMRLEGIVQQYLLWHPFLLQYVGFYPLPAKPDATARII